MFNYAGALSQYLYAQYLRLRRVYTAPVHRTTYYHIIRVFGDYLVGLSFMSSVSYTSIKPIPTHEKIFAVGKSGPNAHFLPTFSWVGLAFG